MELPNEKAQVVADSIPVMTYVIVFVLSAWGGIVHFVRRTREAKGENFVLAELIGDLTISTFVGLIVFLLCQVAGFSQLLSVALCCIASNMGSKALYLIEIVMKSKYLPKEMQESSSVTQDKE